MFSKKIAVSLVFIAAIFSTTPLIARAGLCFPLTRHNFYNKNLGSRVIQRQTECSPSSFDKLVRGLGSHNSKMRASYVKRLTLVITVCKNRTERTESIAESVKQMCNEGEVFFPMSQFWKFEGLTLVLAEVKYTPVLTTLGKCVNNTSLITGMPISYFPAQQALVKYGYTALPVLKTLLSSGEESLRCSISTVISEIGGQEAASILDGAYKNENDRDTLRCIRSALSVAQSK